MIKEMMKGRKEVKTVKGIRTFENFPEQVSCPICHLHTNSECMLVPITGTQEERITEAIPVHTKCIGDYLQYDRETDIFFINK